MIPWRDKGTRRSWGGKHEVPWFLARLGSADASSFERLARVLLRLALSPPGRWLTEGDLQSAEGGYLVAAGEAAMPVFVQLAAFPDRAEDLGAPQVLHCRAAMERFARGPLQAEVYLLVVNRDPRSPAFRTGLAQELADLEAGGRVAHTLAWDPRDLVESALDSLFDLTLAAARRGVLSVAPVESVLAGTPDLVTEVPLRVSWFTADQHRLGPDEDSGRETVADPAALLQKGTSSVRTLLLGGFGFGKTTAVVRSLLRKDLRLLYVPGASLTQEIGTAKVFLARCINSEALFGGAPADERVLYERMLRAVAEHLFKDETLPCALVIDGLDESPFLCRGAGLQHLLNNLETVRIPVILAMRSEYWRSRRGDLTSTAGRLESRGEPRVRRIRKLELLPWREEEILLFIRRFREACADAIEQERLGALISLVEDGGYAEIYGDIPRRPLFLRLIAESAAALGLPGRRIGRARLFRDWALWKICRDLRVSRPHLIIPGEPAEQVLEMAWEAMLRAATCMTRDQEGELELLPDCSFERVRQASPRLEKMADILALSLQSLLQLSTDRTGPRRPRVAFAHRAFQEFFLAWFLAEGSLDHQWSLPISIREWIDDLRREELLDQEGAEEAERPPGLPQAPQGPVLWSPPDSSSSASRAPAAEPADLILHVRERPGGRRRLFDLRLTAQEPELGLRDRSFGTIELLTDSAEFFRRHLKEATGANALRTWGAFFSERILPADLRKKLSALRHRQPVRLLQIVSDETFIPWEILRIEETPQSREVDGPFLAEAFGLTRWFYGIRQTNYLPLSHIAAVVPETSELPHAEQEWNDLRRLAGDGRQIERIPARLQALDAAFRSGQYDGWHFTGHGLFRGSSPDLSGLLLENKETLTPPHLSGTAKRMGVKRPLVFLNACETSQIGLSLTDLGGWVPGFLRAGAGGFIGSLWEIGDSRSRTFAHVFYTSFLAGLPLAEAVQRARQAIRSDDDPTWLAYTVFGHPRAVCRLVPTGMHETEAEPEPLPQAVPHKELETRTTRRFITDKPPQQKVLQVFLCHASQDKASVRTLHTRLSAEGIRPWLDEIDLLPGQDWQLEISSAIRASDVVILCLSRQSVAKSGYVQKEVSRALDIAEEQPEGTIYIVPLRLEECEVPARLRRWHWVDYFRDEGHENLMRALRHRAQTPLP